MENKDEKNVLNPSISRRTFVKASAATTVVAGAAVANPWGSAMKMIEASNEQINGSNEETVVSTGCRSNCFQACRLNAHVRNGKLVKTSAAPYEDEIYTGICLKGLSNVQRTYSPTRIKYPMRRVGERGSDQWERISWDEAISEIGEKFRAIQEQYGNKALAFDVGSGNYGVVHGILGIVNRLTNAINCTRINVCYDQATGYGTDRVIGGGIWFYANEPRTMLDAKNIIVWGSNPVYSQPQNWRIIQEAKRNGVKVITIDPIFSATANESDEYIPIVPGSDSLLALAMINYIIEQNLIDLDFLSKRTTAPFLIRKDNGKILRKSDFESDVAKDDDDYYVWNVDSNDPILLKNSSGNKVAIEGKYVVQGIEVETAFTVLKSHVQQYTVEQASKITKLTTEKIEELAKTFANGPTTIYTNYGIDHYQNGHHWSFAAAIMAAITGNIGVTGAGFSGLFAQRAPLNYLGMYYTNGKWEDNRVAQTIFHEVVRDQQLLGQSYPIKGLFSMCSNSMSNWCEQNVWFDDIYPNLDFSVVVDTEFTDLARHADIVLPAAFWYELNELRVNYNNPYILYTEKIIEPLFESKSDLDIIYLIGRAMGLEEFFPLEDTDIDWIKRMLDNDQMKALNITYERLKEEKCVRFMGTKEKPFIRGEQFFNTDSGRANLYCENPQPRVNYGQDLTGIIEKERLPYFKPPGEAWNENPKFSKYPLVYLQEHSRYRVHSQWYNVPLLRELDPEPLAKISRIDAEKRGIKTGDIVEVFNDRGAVTIKAEVNDAISEGVLSIPKGWQRDQFIEGCYQELTKSESDLMAINFAFFDSLVDVRKV